ncbi:hypothetical protein Vadar_008726 [Vaccinium darrowii]|uniref:Uncharacterized protein n=1 Tax=Vaccinium darrowii TaxID=229202 RepID=A0ACB7ZAG9_9ERIC|nr:hypothetical protein Vadar_008726 [Vaccinium darrowii]
MSKKYVDLCLKESTENRKNSGSLENDSLDRLQANPNAKQFRFTGLQYVIELKALLDGVRAMGRFSFGPSKEGFPADGISSQSQAYIDLDTGSLETPSSPNDSAKPDNKWKRKKKSNELDTQLLEALQTLQNFDGPTIKECNRILDEMELFYMSDPYI